MIDMESIRNNYRTASVKLNRARRLYIFLSRKKFNTAGNDYFDYMADRMIDSGLYAKSSSRKCIRWGVIRVLFKLEYPRFATSSPVYREWVFAKGIDCHSGYFKPIIKQIRPDVMKMRVA